MQYKGSTVYEGGNVKISDYYSEVQPTWCSGCGDYAIWAALKRALVELNLAPRDVLLCFDIGCNGNMSDKIRGYRIHTLHGRALPVAAAAKIANPNLKVIAFAGDGATYSEGINHFLNSVRSNYPITFFVHDNGNYGLTTGQASATTPQCAVRTANPDGPTAETLNPVELALALNPGFVARGFSGELHHLTDVMKQAIAYQDHGFAYVDILQACPTYNKEQTHTWYQERVKKIQEFGDYDNRDLMAAKQLAQNTESDIPIGLLYQNPDLPSYLQRIKHRQEGEWHESLPINEVRKHDVTKLLAAYQ